METLARGALAGLAATVPMTVVIGAGRAAGLMGTPPPVEITENVAEQAGEQPDRQSPEFQQPGSPRTSGTALPVG